MTLTQILHRSLEKYAAPGSTLLDELPTLSQINQTISAPKPAAPAPTPAPAGKLPGAFTQAPAGPPPGWQDAFNPAVYNKAQAPAAPAPSAVAELPTLSQINQPMSLPQPAQPAQPAAPSGTLSMGLGPGPAPMMVNSGSKGIVASTPVTPAAPAPAPLAAPPTPQTPAAPAPSAPAAPAPAQTAAQPPQAPKPEIPASVKAWGSAPTGPGGSTGPSVEQFSTISKQLGDSKLPVEQRRQVATSFFNEYAQNNPERLQGLRDMQAGKDTPAAQANIAELKKRENEFIQQSVKQQAEAAVKENPQLAQDPKSFGQMLSGFAENAMQSFNDMPMPMKLMMGIGLPLGLVGIMSSLFGEGGMGMGLMGLLGIGAAGLAGAGGGMFGQGAQTAVADGLFNLGQASGMIPNVDPKDLAILKEKDPLAAMGNQPIGTREEVAAKLEQVPQQIESLRKLQMLPEGMRARFLQRMDPSMSAEEAQLAVQNAGTLLNAYDNPESDLRTKMQQGQTYVDTQNAPWYSPSGWAGAAMDAMPSDWRTWAAKKFGSDTSIATKLAYQHMTLKAARCWAGYEPVPGKKPYSEDSCRPVGSKKKKQTGKERHHETTQQGGAKG